MAHRSQLQCLNNSTVPYHSHTMTPSSAHSPVNKMATPQRTSSQDSTSDSIRKRVCKACDRCRLKKSKCDGAHPCTRCKSDNAICVFGERKKSHDKVYPKGYVEMLEQQQGQLVSGLQEMYKRLVEANAWKGSPLAETNGNPLTHDILSALDLLEARHDGSGELETFEEDCTKLQSRLLAEGAGYTQQRRGSFSSDSEHSQHSHARSQPHSTPTLSKPAVFKENFAFGSEPPSPPAHSPARPPQRLSYTSAAQPSPLQQGSPLAHDPQLYQAEWAYPETTASYAMRSDFAIQTPEIDSKLNNLNGLPWETTSAPYEANMASFTSYPMQMSNGFGDGPRLQDGAFPGLQADTMDFEFQQYIQVMT
ncbi:Fluconazole resistance protein 1 [Pseudocercospora fuligena]|uniref:Fluconazole resistance protein 1 n=1 Tax=Pseudocercospora fuligena TaxID=685502 RepID=A0A8H6VI86_9PEZI|nr:Fluconazole resistance protein 1 [Pseudocercospora fuligena]